MEIGAKDNVMLHQLFSDSRKPQVTLAKNIFLLYLFVPVNLYLSTISLRLHACM